MSNKNKKTKNKKKNINAASSKVISKKKDNEKDNHKDCTEKANSVVENENQTAQKYKFKRNSIGKIFYKVTTKSNMMVGSQTQSFMVGGVDQTTMVDEEGYPMIPGSTIKGIIRMIVRDNKDDFETIVDFYKELNLKLKKEMESFVEEHPELEHLKDNKNLDWDENKLVECLFGISGVNNMPRLFFSDLRVPEEDRKRNPEEFFLIDSKTSIETTEQDINSNPRTYRVVKPEVSFEGEIYLKGFSDKGIINNIKEGIGNVINLLNEGYYSIGNSKSRGYGRVEIEVICDEDK